eukprot:RCo054898
MSTEFTSTNSTATDRGSCIVLNPTLILPHSAEPTVQSPTSESASPLRASCYQHLAYPALPSQRGTSAGRQTTHRTTYSAESIEGPIYPVVRGGRSIPLRVVFVVVLCLFAVGPAVAMWIISWRSGQDALNGVQVFAMTSVEGVSVQLQDSLITSVQSSLEAFVERAETALDQGVSYVYSSGVLGKNGSDVAGLVPAMKHFQEAAFSITRRSPWMFTFNISIFADVWEGSAVVQTVLNAWLNIDLTTQRITPTLYNTGIIVNSFLNETWATSCVVNTTTGEPNFCFSNVPVSHRAHVSAQLPNQPICQWENTMSFMVVIGLPMALLTCWVPFADRHAWAIAQTTANVYTISSLLLSLLSAPNDRLFLIFRTVEGTMVGASHGKFFSHSDINFDAINPFINPPPISEFRLYSAENSTDATIRNTAVWLMQRYHRWDAVPELNATLDLSTGSFWMRSVHISSAHGLQWQVFLLIDSTSRLGPVLARN